MKTKHQDTNIQDQAKVSILVPIYGVEKYIEQCARSLFEQTYPHIEYIFVNDCTKDKSLEILKACIEHYPQRKEQITIINHETNGGLGQTRCTGINAATGDYYFIADSDDFLPADAIELLVNKAKETDADIIEGAYYRYKTSSRHAKLIPPLHGRQDLFLKLILCQKYNSFVWGKLYRAELFKDDEIFFTKGIDFKEDYAIVPRLIFKGRRAVIDDPVYYYRLDNEDSYTHHISFEDAISEAKANEILRKFFQKNDTEGKYKKAFDFCMLSLYRNIHKYGVNRYDFLSQEVNYRPATITGRLIVKLYKNGKYAIADKLFRSYRRRYLLYLRTLIAICKE